MIDRIIEAAQRHPGRIAVQDALHPATYRELLARVEELEGALRHHVEAGRRRLLVDSGKGLDGYACVVASVASGAMFCVANPDLPVARRERIHRDFAPQLVFADGDLRREPVVASPATDAAGSEGDRVSRCAYVMYTSGSTGHPKGVKISYGNLEWFLGSVLPVLAVPPTARWSNHPSLAFDLSILDVFGCFASGCTLVPLTDPFERAFPARCIRDAEINVWQSVPSLVESMRRSRAGENGFLRSLELVILCGEPCRREWVQYLLDYCAEGVRVFNCYGPTETTVFCSVEEIATPYVFEASEACVPIGSPLPGATIDLDGVGDGLSELVVSGPGVGLGYVGASAEGSSYAEVAGRRVYRTGDLASEKSGALYFRGRADRQVKLRGNRFELDEVEHAVSELFGVVSYAVAVDDHVELFLGSDVELSDDEIDAGLRTVLPNYAAPRLVHRLDEWPRNLNLKVDRAQLTLLADRRRRSE